MCGAKRIIHECCATAAGTVSGSDFVLNWSEDANVCQAYLPSASGYGTSLTQKGGTVGECLTPVDEAWQTHTSTANAYVDMDPNKAFAPTLLKNTNVTNPICTIEALGNAGSGGAVSKFAATSVLATLLVGAAGVLSML